MPNGSSEGVKVIRWKPVFRSDRTAKGVTGKPVNTPSPAIRCHLATLSRVEVGRSGAERRVTVTVTAVHLLIANAATHELPIKVCFRG
jgi:hypothetical protein